MKDEEEGVFVIPTEETRMQCPEPESPACSARKAQVPGMPGEGTGNRSSRFASNLHGVEVAVRS